MVHYINAVVATQNLRRSEMIVKKKWKTKLSKKVVKEYGASEPAIMIITNRETIEN